ncbi:MAG TPA: patatin-like phospholipase family protein, partial [Mariprofundaceae bacterium]|nr:patatin-like phospholipase family protein [Mariprofundaceae bacterium]
MKLLSGLFNRFRRPDGFVLALGGGGGRGLAHLGVLEVLEEHKLRPAAIVGTSIGALFGAMYAHTPDAGRIRNRVTRYLNSEKFSQLNIPLIEGVQMGDATWLSRLVAVTRQSILYTRAATDIAVADINSLIEMVRELCTAEDFADLKIPMYVTSVQFPTGECHLISKGDLSRAIAASMAVPGVFDPVEIEGARFVDGALSSEVPAREGRMVAAMGQVVVAVNVGSRPDPTNIPTHLIGMIDWATQVKALYLRQYE